MDFKFTDLFETKYLYVTFQKDVNYVLNKCTALQKDPNTPCHPLNATCASLFNCVKYGTHVEFDLAGVSMTSDITPYITEFTRKGLVFKDSGNSYRNKLLQENARRITISKDNFVDLPTFDLNMKASDWIRNLPSGVVLVPSVHNVELYLPLVVMAMLLRHKLNFCIDNIQSAFFQYFKDKLSLEVLSKFDEFFVYVPNEGVYIQSFNPKGYIQSLGLVTIEDAVTAAYLVPTAITKCRAIDLDEQLGIQAFKPIFNECRRIVNSYIENRKVHLDEVL